jgi:hypothetical protein
MRKNRVVLLAGLILPVVFFCESCSPAKTVAIKKIETESSIGLEYPARAENRAPVFNGDFELGTAGFGLKSVLDASVAFNPDLKYGLETTNKKDGKGNCLRIKSTGGSPRFTLMGREVYIPKAMKLKMTFHAKLENPEKADAKIALRVDFRHVKPGKIRDSKEKYSISGGSVTLGSDWNMCTVNIDAKIEGYYRYCIFTDLAAEKSLPGILIDSISLAAENESFGKDPCPQVAVYTDKSIPAYLKEDEVKYTIKALLPDHQGNTADVSLEFYNEQTKIVSFTKSVILNKRAGGIFEGCATLIPAQYGPFGLQVKYKGRVVDSFGGETLVLHPNREHQANEIGFRIGTNFHNLVEHMRGQAENDKRQFWNSSASHSEKIEDQFELLRLAGFKTINLGLMWLYMEPEEGKWDLSAYDKVASLCRKYNVKVIGLLGPHFSLNAKTGKPLDLPEWLVKYSTKHKITPFHNWEGCMPPEKLWAGYCKKLAARYKDVLCAMSVLGEPKAWCTPEEYMVYLKSAHEAVKSEAPEIQIIGVDPTGDGDSPRFIEWSKLVLDQGAEEYLDGFAYHPYGAANDFQMGDYFEATDVINKVKSLLKKPATGLWNLECFQHTNSKYKRSDRWDASTALRHYLITLGNGAKTASPHDLYELRKDRLNPHVRIITPWVYEKIPAPLTAATNYLSFALEDTTEARVVEINNFARTYLFANESGSRALGVAWYLRPGGCTWTSSASNAAVLSDMFGNKLEKATEISLGYDPVYISGNKKNVEEYLTKSQFLPVGGILDVKGRIFKTALLLDAKNNLGKPERLGIKIEKTASFEFPELCEFAFSKNIYCQAKIPDCVNQGAPASNLKYQTFLLGKHFSDGEIEIIPATKCFDLPFGNAKPLDMELRKGSKLTFYATKEYLCMTATVKDKTVTAPATHLWEADAVEIFVDNSPVSKLDSSSTKKVRQYVFSAKPSAATGLSSWEKLQAPDKAVSKSTLTDDGYVIEAKIPWRALLPDTGYSPPMIYGIEVTIDHVSPGEKPEYETLSGVALPSFQQRFHYPLFGLPAELYDGLADDSVGSIEAPCLKNSSFLLEGKRSMPLDWWLNPEGFWQYGRFGLNGKVGVKISVPAERSDKNTPSAAQKIPCDKLVGKEIIIELLAKGENLRTTSDKSAYNPGLRLMAYFQDKEAKDIPHTAQGIGIDKPFIDSFGWSILQFSAKVPENAAYVTVHCGFSRTGCAGDLYLSDVYLKTCSVE